MAAADLIKALLNPNHEAPFARIRVTQLEDLRQLLTLFQARLNKPGEPTRV